MRDCGRSGLPSLCLAYGAIMAMWTPLYVQFPQSCILRDHQQQVLLRGTTWRYCCGCFSRRPHGAGLLQPRNSGRLLKSASPLVPKCPLFSLWLLLGQENPVVLSQGLTAGVLRAELR